MTNLVAWALLGLLAAAVMMGGSRVAVQHAIPLSDRLGVPQFLVGLTLIALGTDLPEIVNSLVSSYRGHGDINVGDSIGSVFTQGSLVLGLVPFAVRRPTPIARRDALLLAGLTIGLLALGASLMRDGAFERRDAIALAVGWLAATALAVRSHAIEASIDRPARPTRGARRHAAMCLAALAVVAGGASLLVSAVAALAAGLGVPEYVLSFFAASLGTSLPELVVNLTAMRRGHRGIALGGVLGACLMDASISAAAGPLFFPTAVTADLALRGAGWAMAAIGAAGAVLAARGKHDRASGAVLVALYLAIYAAFARAGA